MQAEILKFLQSLYEEGQQHDVQEPERRHKRLNLETDTAQFLSILVRSSRRQRILEIGTSNGYSTIWLAWAARSVGGEVISIEREAEKQEQARQNLARAGLSANVELVCGDATEAVARLTGPFDCVFFDADRFSAPEQLRLLLSRLTPEAFLLADNVLSHPQEIAGYLEALNALPDFERMVIPIGKGLSVAYRAG
jgi:predicted O-methyltransferase YrrM